jgi:hypothetical protein
MEDSELNDKIVGHTVTDDGSVDDDVGKRNKAL